jgi:hypothetical protein
MNFDTDLVSRDINDSRRRAEELTSGLTAEQLTLRPQPDKWSIAECIAHLNMTAFTVQHLMAGAIERGKQEKKFGSGPFSIGAKGRLLVWIAEPPPKFKIPAPKGVRPPARIDDPLQLLPAFLNAQDEWERLAHEQQGLHLAKIKIGALTSPFRARLAAAIPWMMAHQRRHLLQAELVRKQLAEKISSHIA